MRATRREEISNYLIYIKKEKEIFTMRKVKRIKNVLCVLLATIISLVSMTTVKADGEVAPYEDMENATLLQKECYDLDEDTMIEITTYEKSIPSFARSSWKTKTGTRTYRIINKCKIRPTSHVLITKLYSRSGVKKFFLGCFTALNTTLFLRINHAIYYYFVPLLKVSE